MRSDLRERQVDRCRSGRYISPRSKQSKQPTRRNRTGHRGSRKVEPGSQTREGRKATASRSGRPQGRNGGPDRGRTRKGESGRGPAAGRSRKAESLAADRRESRKAILRGPEVRATDAEVAWSNRARGADGG